jgi:hypothetical protein
VPGGKITLVVVLVIDVEDNDDVVLLEEGVVVLGTVVVDVVEVGLVLTIGLHPVKNSEITKKTVISKLTKCNIF